MCIHIFDTKSIVKYGYILYKNNLNIIFRLTNILIIN